MLKAVAEDRRRRIAAIGPHHAALSNRRMVAQATASGNRGAANLVSGAVTVYRSDDFWEYKLQWFEPVCAWNAPGDGAKCALAFCANGRRANAALR